MRTYEEIMEDETLDLENDMNAMYELGISLLEGNGCKVDKEKGWHWIQKAANSGCEKARVALETKTTIKETAVLDYSSMSELTLFEKARQKDIVAALHLYDCTENAMADDEMFELFKNLSNVYQAETEHIIKVQYLLACMYALRMESKFGIGDIEQRTGATFSQKEIETWRNLIKKSLQHASNAADLGSEEALFMVMQIYRNQFRFLGNTVEKTNQLMEHFANQDHPDICFDLGYPLLENGQKRAAELYFKRVLDHPNEKVIETLPFYQCEYYLLGSEETIHTRDEIIDMLMQHLDDARVLKMMKTECFDHMDTYGLQKTMEIHNQYCQNCTEEELIQNEVPLLLDALNDLNEEELLLCAKYHVRLRDLILRYGVNSGYDACFQALFSELHRPVDQAHIQHRIKFLMSVINDLKKQTHPHHEEAKRYIQNKIYELQNELDQLNQQLAEKKAKNDALENKTRKTVVEEPSKPANHNHKKFVMGVVMLVAFAVLVNLFFGLSSLLDSVSKEDILSYINYSYQGYSPFAELNVWGHNSYEVTKVSPMLM